MVSLEKPFGEGFSNGDERNARCEEKGETCIGKWTKYERFRDLRNLHTLKNL